MYLQQVAASASAARVAAGAASVSSASAAASATRIENNLELLRETISEVLELTQRLYHYIWPRGRNIAHDVIRGRSSSRARGVPAESRRGRDVLGGGRENRAHKDRSRDERGRGERSRRGGRDVLDGGREGRAREDRSRNECGRGERNRDRPSDRSRSRSFRGRR